MVPDSLGVTLPACRGTLNRNVGRTFWGTLRTAGPWGWPARRLLGRKPVTMARVAAVR